LSEASEAELIGDSAGYSVIRLHRRRGFYQDSLRAYRVRIDGNPLGKIAKGETRDFIVPPGEHRVRLTIDRLAGSREVMHQVREGELVEFTCRPGHPALALWWPLPLLCIVFPVIRALQPQRLWGQFALLLAVVSVLLLVLVLLRHRWIRLDGPRVMNRA
jgi:hypothetical protein